MPKPPVKSVSAGRTAVERRTVARPLRAVGPADVKPVAKSVTEAATSGTHLELLIALRTRIARTVESDGCPPRDLASLSKRLGDLAKEIEAIRAADLEEAADDEAATTPDEPWAAV